MKSAYLYALAFSALAFGACSSDEPNDPFHDPKWPLTDNITLSSVDTRNIAALSNFNDKILTQSAITSDDGAFCVSPLSISIYLGMVANSSQGEGRQQIINALNCSNLDDFNSLSTRLLKYIPSSKNGVITHIANKIWMADRYTVPESYVNSMAQIFNAGVEKVDFATEQTRNNINNWASYHTKGLIDCLFEKDDWADKKDMQMVWANTVYFNGTWDNEFDKEDTENEVFHAVGGDVTVPMMNKLDYFRYAENDKAQMISLDYKQKATAFEIYLPAEGTDVHQIPEIINEAERDALRAASDSKNVMLKMPSFTMDGDTQLDYIFNALGITAFKNFDFSPMGISDKIPDKYNLITQHKTTIKVDEKGTEAAAVTFNGLETSPGPTEIIEMTVDRPFLFILRNKATDTILMAGVVASPQN